jgi:hypothetical protein
VGHAVDHEEASVTEVETPAGQEPISIAATPATNAVISSSSSTISGDSINVCKSSQTAFTCDRHNSIMADLNSLYRMCGEMPRELPSMYGEMHKHELQSTFLPCTMEGNADIISDTRAGYDEASGLSSFDNMADTPESGVGKDPNILDTATKYSCFTAPVSSENKLQEDKAGHCEERPMAEVYSTLSVTAQTQLDTVMLFLFLYTTSTLDGLDTTRLVSHVPMTEQSALNS